jgi:hypothetical protein
MEGMERYSPSRGDQGSRHTDDDRIFEERVPVSNSSSSTRRTSNPDSELQYPDTIRSHGRHSRHIHIQTDGFTSPWEPSSQTTSQLSLGSTLPGGYRSSLGASTIFDFRESQAAWGINFQSPHNIRPRSATLKEDKSWNMASMPGKSTLSIMEKGSLTPKSLDSQQSPTFSYSQKEGSASSVINHELTHISIETSEPQISPLREALLIVVLCSGQFLALACLAQTIVPQNIIGESLGADSPGMLVWFTASYSMVYASFIMISGKSRSFVGYLSILIGTCRTDRGHSRSKTCVSLGLGVDDNFFVSSRVLSLSNSVLHFTRITRNRTGFTCSKRYCNHSTYLADG